MRNRPNSLVFLSLILLGVAISFPVQIMILFDHDPMEWEAILAKLTPLNWATMFALLASAFSIFHALPQTLPLAFLTILVVNWNNYVAGSYEINYSWSSTFLASIGFFLLHGLLFETKARAVILNPSLRWWRYPMRKMARVEMQVRRLNGEVFNAITHDVSTGGAFIPFFSVQSYAHHELSPPLIPNDEEYVMVDFAINDTPINCQARVVRKATAQGTYPAGIGLQFLDLQKRERRLLNRYIKNAPLNTRQFEVTS